jgi:hypothetical protein
LILNPQISTVLKNAKKQDLAFYQEETLGENPSFRNCFVLLDLEGKNSKCQSVQDLGIFGYWWTQI